MSTFYVDWKILSEKAGELMKLNSTLKTQAESYVQNANSLKSSFDGDVADDFYNEVTNHKAKIDAFTAVVDQYVSAMNTLAEDARTKSLSAQQVVSQKNF